MVMVETGVNMDAEKKEGKPNEVNISNHISMMHALYN